jgi:hypothetical protein
VTRPILLPKAHGRPLVGLLVAMLLFAAGRSPGAESRTPVFDARTADGKTPAGPLLKLGDQWDVRLGGTNPALIDAGELLDLRRTGKDLPDRPSGPNLLFTNGDCLPFREVKLDGEKVHCRLDNKERTELQIPLSAVSVLWLTPPADPEERAKLRRRWLADKRPRDVVRLRNGDTVEGTLTGLEAAVVQFESDGKKVDFALEKVAAVTLSTELASIPKPKGAHGRLLLANGSRLTLAKAQCTDGQTLTATTLYDARLNIPVDEVMALYIYQGKAVYLSDLKPSKFEAKPFGTLEWPPVADAGVSGRDLRLAGSTYDKGMGLHSESRLTYNLAGAYRRFEALVGLEEQPDGRTGTARVKVLVDGKPRPLDGDEELSAKSKPLAIRLDVQNAKELTLVVEFGKRGDVLGRVNWVDARLVK